MKRRVAILISGRGSNMAALIDAAKAEDFPAEIVAVTVYVALAPTGRFTTSFSKPEPAGVHGPTQVQLIEPRAPGKESVTVAASAADGPLLVATIVYVIAVPGTAAATLSVLVIDRSVTATSVSTSEAVLSTGDVSVTDAGTAAVAVLVKRPVAAALMWTVTTYVSWPAGRRFAVSAKVPLPDAEHDDPAVAVHVQFIVVAPAGSASVIDAPMTVDGPALTTVTV